MSKLNRTLLVCPTFNPGSLFCDWLNGVKLQSNRPGMSVIIDSASDDGSISMAQDAGFVVEVIDRKAFNHGGTRQKAVDSYKGFEYVIFLTQDAILYDDGALDALLMAFDDADVAAVCGRQLPRKGAAPIEAHARLYNYPDRSKVNSLNPGDKKGLKTAFLSNSFAAYRISALTEVGGFPSDVIFGEDMYVATRLLISGYKIAYESKACVFHSHYYTFIQEFKRYFDMGVFHSRAPWIRHELGGAEGEGMKFVISELKYLYKHAFWLIPESMMRTLFRYAGFRLGLAEEKLPPGLKVLFAMNKGYFK